MNSFCLSKSPSEIVDYLLIKVETERFLSLL